MDLSSLPPDLLIRFLALAALCYAVGAVVKIALKGTKWAPAVAPKWLQRWRGVLIPLAPELVGSALGAAGVLQVDTRVWGLVLGFVAGAGPIVWASFAGGVRKARAQAKGVDA